MKNFQKGTCVSDSEPKPKITILPPWRGDCDEPKVQVVQIHPNSRRVSGFEE
jgi:hypothetical protein